MEIVPDTVYAWTEVPGCNQRVWAGIPVLENVSRIGILFLKVGVTDGVVTA